MGAGKSIWRNPFSFLFTHSKKEKVLTEYVIREHHKGRSLDEILQDKYVVNNSSHEQIRRLLDQPELIRAIGQDTVAAAHRPAGL
jgi:hypothetical protein